FIRATAGPAFGLPTQMRAPFNVAGPSPFLQPGNRTEHHRDIKVHYPTIPAYEDVKPLPPAMFSSRGAAMLTPADGYPQIGADPGKAEADLKALREGGMDEEEDGEEEDKRDGGAGAEDAKEKDAEKKPDPKGTGIQADGTLEGIEVKLLPHQVEGVK